MKNIFNNEENLDLFNKEGKKVYTFYKSSTGFSYEKTYDSNGKELTYKNSDGYSYKKTYDSNGKELTYKNSDGVWYEKTYDSNGKELTYKDSNRFSYEKTYDSNGKELTYKDSDSVTRGFDIPEYTMEELVAKLGNFKIKK
jgi:YD repeat-containing protein